MKLKFTRHSKGRMRLYDITPGDVETVLKKCKKIKNYGDSFEAIATLRKFIYPVKVIFRIIDDYKLIITVYPLKRKL